MVDLTIRDRRLMDMARLVGEWGTCSRLRVGVVFSRRGRVISTGYNGAPSGLPHCDHECHCTPETDSYGVVWPHNACNSLAPCETASHAEANGIAFAARHGVELEGADMHVTHMPCLVCARLSINAGIETVVFGAAYRKTEGIELLEAAGVTVVDLSDYQVVR